MIVAVDAAPASAASVKLTNNNTRFCLHAARRDLRVSNPDQGDVFGWECNGSRAQQWTLRYTGGGNTLTSVDTGQCLDSNWNFDAYLLSCNGGDYQKWQLSVDEWGNAVFRSAVTGYALRMLGVRGDGQRRKEVCTDRFRSGDASEQWWP